MNQPSIENKMNGPARRRGFQRRLLEAFWAVAIVALIATTRASDSSTSDANWTPLLDQNLTKWEIWIGVPDPSVPLPGYVHAADPKNDKPLGLNQDPLHVYTVRNVDGEPRLHISGQIFGGLTTKATFGNFDLRVQQRWGTEKFAPKLGKPRDNGILYRCFGPHGMVNHSWKHCIECQVQEQDIGDFFSLGVQAEVACKQYSVPGGGKPLYRYTPGEPLHLFRGRCARGLDYQELPNGEWNTIEVMAVGDRSIHILNGHVVNVLRNAENSVGGPKRPMTAGQIQIQSEGAETEYRRVEIRPLDKFSPEYEALFAASAPGP